MLLLKGWLLIDQASDFDRQVHLSGIKLYSKDGKMGVKTQLIIKPESCLVYDSSSHRLSFY